jgi:DNA transformation protein
MKTPPSPPPRGRGRLTSMRVSSGFRDFVLGQLSEVPSFRARAMFGGIGLYAGETFFGIVAADVLYFKVGDANRPDYERAGASPFVPYADRRMSMSYYSVPPEVLEDPETLGRWAAKSLQVAKATRKPSRKKG